MGEGGGGMGIDCVYNATEADRRKNPDDNWNLYGEVCDGVWINYATSVREAGLLSSFSHLGHVDGFVVCKGRLCEGAD